MRNTTLRVLARSCLVSLFIPSALDKIFNWDEAIKQAKQGPLPRAAPLLMTAAIATEIMTPLAIVSGRKDREAAALRPDRRRVNTKDTKDTKNGRGESQTWSCLCVLGVHGVDSATERLTAGLAEFRIGIVRSVAGCAEPLA